MANVNTIDERSLKKSLGRKISNASDFYQRSSIVTTVLDCRHSGVKLILLKTVKTQI